MWTPHDHSINENLTPERLCVEIAMLVRRYCPQLRVMQFINNFQAWMGSDCFYLTNYQTLLKMKEYCKTLKTY